MKTGYMILSAASIIPLLSSCASYQKTADSEAWSIKPAFNVRHSTETPDAYYQLGRYYQGQNRHELAIEAYQKALAIDGTFAEARNGLGVNYAMQGRQQEALEQFRLAVQQAPNAAHIHNNLGYALYLSGSYAEAASALERAVALEPANQAAHTNLALALGKAGDRGKAVQVMAQAASPQPAENVPPVAQEAQQALALPKDWGVITQAARKPVPQVESRIQAVQVEPNVYELRERADVQVVSAARPQQQASVQPKERDRVAAQAAQPVSKVVKAAPAARPYRIEVSNGNGVTGMARKVAGFLGGEGYSRARLTNQKPFQVTSSQVLYRSGYREQAQSLVSTLPGKPGIAQADNLRGDITIRVVLGKDVAGNVAYFERSQGKIRLVRHGSDS
ncbi:MAG: tetratricopeptide repeat protein [Sulfuricella sp.]|nr:tetratricopeptide repeat protein [Sulfuricella sp.]